MLSIQGAPELRRIVVLNPKGGAGKTTLASNLAGYFAASGRKVAIVDMDPQGSTMHWLGRRPAEFPEIHGVFAAPDAPGVPAAVAVTLPPEIEVAIVDSPAGVPRAALPDFTVGSHAIIVPVMPSEFDIHAASRLIGDLLIVARVSRENRRLGVIANRVKERTVAFKQLMKFLNRLSIPIVGVIRDSQNYVTAAREGLSIHELPRSKAGKDLEQWQALTDWLEQRIATPLNERDLLRPTTRQQPQARPAAARPARRFQWQIAVAVVLVLLAFPVLVWHFAAGPDGDPPLAPTATLERPPQTAPVRIQPAPMPAEPVATMPVPAPAEPDPPAADPPTHEVGGGIGRTVRAGDLGAPPGARAEAELVEPASAEPGRPPQPSDELFRQWRLSGVARASGELVVFLTDSTDAATRKVSASLPFEGWRLKEAGPDYAVLEKAGEEVRLKLRN